MSDETKTIATEAERHVESFSFQVDISKVMLLMINKIFTNKEIFLRELILNANNALDKICHESLMDPSKLHSGNELGINIILNRIDHTLTITDTGIGMTKADLVNNLGRIVRLADTSFIEACKAGTDISTIGMGFYSAYLVAEKVTVITKHNDDEQYIWKSRADGWFTVRRDTSEPLKRGTKIVLYIKEDQYEFLKGNRIKEIVKKYSQFMIYPIKLLVQKGLNEDEDENEQEESEEEKDEYKEILNTNPIWSKNPSEITRKEYCGLYKSITNDWENYLAMRHFCKKGQLHYEAIFFIPCHQLLRRRFDKNNKQNIKLYIRHMLVTSDCEQLMPEYLKFISGIINCENLPFNISREMLPIVLQIIHESFVKKCLQLLDDLTKDKKTYMRFYKQFSKNIKQGIYEDVNNRDKLIQLLRYHTSASDDGSCSLNDYISRMKVNQKYIYFIAGQSKEQVENSSFVERVKKCNFEVIYMIDPLDEYIVQYMKQIDGKQMMCLTEDNLELPEDQAEKKKREENKIKFENLCKVMKNILDDKVEKVVISNRLVDSPCCIVTPQCGSSGNMEKIMNALPLFNNIGYTITRKYLEINPDHAIIKNLWKKTVHNKEDNLIRDVVILLFETALVPSGFNLEKPSLYLDRIYKMIKFGLDLDWKNSISDK